MPRLTIITINKNDAEGLKRTLRSIWEKQTFDDLEHIVIDGASTDNSIDVIRKYERNLAYWISEPDGGVYNAMNKGIVKSRGDYLLFLNSGDWLEDDVLARVFKDDFSEDIVYADLYYYRKANDVELGSYPDKLTLPFIFTHSLGHPSTFIKRELFKDMLYDEKYKIISDWTFFVKQILLYSRSTKHLNVAVSYFNVYGISSDPKNKDLISREQSDFFGNEFPHHISEFYQEYTLLREKAGIQEQALDIMSKHKIQQLLDSVWIQRKARQYIKFLFWLRRIFKLNVF
ncbi:glycosyltransferase family 2 protein [Bacteroides congonensis]|uniref:glycosyltransferase family 2 protein n=1 Tax=Bacteroides congonensis TaxID=1871006 RepID=UPI00093306B8|nr:glycosyltransferase family 2 protein [Bacteroides congonensis]